MINLLNTYNFTTNHGDTIEIKAYFREEAIIEFQENHQQLGMNYYKPTVFIKLKKVS